jgi:hypothetical protein
MRRGTAADSGPAGSDEWDVLATALNRCGIRHVAPDRWVHRGVPIGQALIRALLTATSIRLQEAVTPFLLTYPERAADVQGVIVTLEGRARERAIGRYVAAAALQRLWRSRLACWLGPQPLIPDAYRSELGLPPLTSNHGEDTLWALAEWERSRWGHNAWAGYTALMDLFLTEITRPGWGGRDAAFDAQGTD